MRFCETFKEELIPVFLKLFQEIEEGKLTYLFYKASITLMPKPDKGTKKLLTNILDEHRGKNAPQNISKL